ncbi:MAG: TatD family hydrolase [Planctomycetota bacterium]|jgi:TatD DNase family protein
MPVYDAHCHLDQLKDPDRAMERARAAGVHRILAVSEGIDSGKKALELKARHGPTVLAGLGIHPMLSVDLSIEDVQEGLNFIETHLEQADVLGEVGLDYKYAVTDEQQTFQHELLSSLLDLAKAAGKPVNLHSRRAQRQTMNRAIEFTRESGLPALMHWFTSSKKLIRICAEEGVFVSAGPSLLFDEHACEVARHIPDHLLLVETDSPVPFGGKPAEPAWAMQVAEKLAKIRDIPLAALESQLNENFARYLRE